MAYPAAIPEPGSDWQWWLGLVAGADFGHCGGESRPLPCSGHGGWLQCHAIGGAGATPPPFLRLFPPSLPPLSSSSHSCCRQIRRFHPRLVAIRNSGLVGELKEALAGMDNPPEILAGEEGIVEVRAHHILPFFHSSILPFSCVRPHCPIFGSALQCLAAFDTDMRQLCATCQVARYHEAVTVVTGIVGCAGLKPTCAAIEAGKDIALANKETLIAGGPYVLPLAKKHGINILPADSEHSAIFQVGLRREAWQKGRSEKAGSGMGCCSASRGCRRGG